MKRYLEPAILLVMALLFLVANRGAYHGYFSADDLDNISWTHITPARTIFEGLLLPKYNPGNFRPVGHAYFVVMSKWQGLNFPPYVAVLHSFHLLNVILVWLLLKELAFPLRAVISGSLIFAFHMAVFDAYWKPMYIFDVLCGTFCLLSILAYLKRSYILSFLCFWLAYKAKEPALMLPLVLALAGYWRGLSLRALIPFFGVTAIFGVQVLMQTPKVETDYTLRFNPHAVWKCILFYASKVLLVPYAGFALLALPLLHREKRLYFGLATSILFLLPMLLLPGRLYPAYLYVPIIGLSIVAASLAEAARVWHLVLFFALWIPLHYGRMRANRKATIAIGDNNRIFVNALADAAKKYPGLKGAVYEGGPSALEMWGFEGALKYFYGVGLQVFPLGEKDLAKNLPREAALFAYEPGANILHVTPRLEHDSSVVTVGWTTQPWQFEEGWYRRENHFRWTAPSATARVYRPPDAKKFMVQLNLGPIVFEQMGRIELEVILNGYPLGLASYTKPGQTIVEWPLQPGPPGDVEVEFRATHDRDVASQDTKTLGVPIMQFGFRQ
jgi:hypothetical protein